MKFSIITPTVDVPHGSGRAYHWLKTAIKSVIDGGHEDFEQFVACDGDVPAIRELVESFNDQRIKYVACDYTGRFGNPQRNQMLERATGDYILYLDHDDNFVPGAIGKIAEECELWPGRLLVVQIINPLGLVFWNERGAIKHLNVGGQMFIVPNDARQGRWLPDNEYGADFNYCVETYKNHLSSERKPVWIPLIVQDLRPWATKSMAGFGTSEKQTSPSS